MPDDLDISSVAGLLSDRTRARMLWALIDGTSRPAGELAFAANVSAQSASTHLAKLVEAGLLRVDAQGRHRYFRISSREIAAIVESIASLAAATRPRSPRTLLPTAATPLAFLRARTCYGHLAGETAVRILDAMLESGWLVAEGRDYAVTRLGHSRFERIGIDSAGHQRRRVFARACVDLTQRRPHLSGVLGDRMLEAFVAKGWVLRQRRSRVVTITPSGSVGFREAFGLHDAGMLLTR
jgi:DNA-binding transcriptional ArsR family regulator